MPNRYKKSLPVLTGFLLSLLFVEIGVRALSSDLPDPIRWPSIESEIKYTQMRGMANSPVEVVLLGDSTMESGADPRSIIESSQLKSVYNAAVPWSTPLSMDLWLHHVVGPLLRPRLVFVGLAPSSVATSTRSDLLYQGLSVALDGGEQDSLDELLADTSAFFRYRTLVRDLPVVLRRERVIESGLITPLGFQSGYLRGLATAAGSETPVTEYLSSGVSIDNEEALTRMAGVAELLGGQLVFVLEPIPCRSDPTSCTEEFSSSAFFKDVSRIASKLGVEMLELNHQPWSPDLFVDDRHLNAEGVHRLEEFLQNAAIPLLMKENRQAVYNGGPLPTISR